MNGRATACGFLVLAALVPAATARAGQTWSPSVTVQADWIQPADRDDFSLGRWDGAGRVGVVLGGRHASGFGLGLTLARETWCFDDEAGPTLVVDAVDGGALYTASLEDGIQVWPVGVRAFYEPAARGAWSLQVYAGVDYAWADEDEATYRVTGEEYFGATVPVQYRSAVEADDTWRASAGAQLGYALNEASRLWLSAAYLDELGSASVRARAGGSPAAPLLDDRVSLDYCALVWGAGWEYRF